MLPLLIGNSNINESNLIRILAVKGLSTSPNDVILKTPLEMYFLFNFSSLSYRIHILAGNSKKAENNK